MALKNIKVVFDRRKKAAQRGRGTVEIMVYLNREQRKFIPIGECTPLEWPRMQTNKAVLAQARELQAVVYEMETNGLPMTIDTFNVVAGFTAKEEAKREQNLIDGSFLEYMRENILADDIAPYTKQQRLVALRSLEEFKKIKKFRDLTPANIQDYDLWLRQPHKGKKYAGTTIDNYHKRVHRYVHRAYQRGIIERDPYDSVTIAHGKNKERKPLLESELLKVRTMELPTKSLERVRDLFVFAAYTGLAYVDVMGFNFQQMVEQNGDLYYIDGKRTKTGSDFYTPILPPAMEVLKKYKYELPCISNAKVNLYLHAIEAHLGLNKPLTFHVARHTFATVVLSHDVPIEKVARMLGHKNIKTTQVYGKILKSTIQHHSDRLATELM